MRRRRNARAAIPALSPMLGSRCASRRTPLRVTRYLAQVGGVIDTNGADAFEEGVVVSQPRAGWNYRVYRFSGAAWTHTGTIPDSSSSFASMHNGILAIINFDTKMLTTYRVAEDSVHQVWRQVGPGLTSKHVPAHRSASPSRPAFTNTFTVFDGRLAYASGDAAPYKLRVLELHGDAWEQVLLAASHSALKP